MNRRYWIYLILVLIGIGLAIYYFNRDTSESDPKEEAKKYAHLETRTITNKLLISGHIASSKEVSLKSELAGIISQLFVQIGDEVKKGMAIAKIKILPDPKNTQDAQRQVINSEIELEKVVNDFGRYQFLYDSGVISKQEYDAAVRDYKLAKENLEAAKKNRKIVKQGYASKSDFVSDVIYSTIDGQVLDIPVKVGTSITNRNTFNDGTTIATIADMHEILFKGKVSENALKYLAVGKKLNIKINALDGPSYSSTITRIAPKGVDEGGIIKFEIEAKIDVAPTEQYKIKSGFSAVADLILEEVKDAQAIEDKYIQYNLDTAYVMIQTKEKQPKKMNIVTGISDGQYTQVLMGLKKDDNIIKESNKLEE